MLRRYVIMPALSDEGRGWPRWRVWKILDRFTGKIIFTDLTRQACRNEKRYKRETKQREERYNRWLQ